MLKIDYSLIELDEDDRRWVDEEVSRRVRSGNLPEIERSRSGRVVVLNPDPVQTNHPVPDALRPRLRRVLVSAQEGSSHLRAERLFNAIVDSDEPLYVLLLELQSEFRALPQFLRRLPELRERYPELGVYASGTLQALVGKLRQVLQAGGATLLLEVAGDSGTVEIPDEQALDETLSLQEETVQFATPFFSQIRLVLDNTGRAIPFNVDSLRRLHPVFGHGEPVEVEVGGGRRDRMVEVDLPPGVIRDFQFRASRGLEFHGVIMENRPIYSRYFAEESLEYRWIPWADLQAVLRRLPGEEEEQVELNRLQALRVNCLTGQITFVMRQPSDRISVERVRRFAFRFNDARPERGRKGADTERPSRNPLVTIDGFVRPALSASAVDPVQQRVREHFYGRYLRDELERERKLGRFAKRLRVAAVGPMAGQTLKLLRRHGLEELIAPDAFHYLSDSPADADAAQRLPQAYEGHFGGLVRQLRTLARSNAGNRTNLAEVAYSMPISTEWTDTDLAKFSSATSQELEAVYHEMGVLSDFIAGEFRRHFDIGEEDLAFFQQMRAARNAGLVAKWLADFKRGAYGAPLEKGEDPDVVFYGTPEERAEGDALHRYPSLACAELFREPVNHALFARIDYDFCVFLEEQMALAVHYAREDGVFQPGLKEYDSHFAARIREQQGRLEELEQSVAAIDDAGSPQYQAILKEEEEAYYARYRQFLQDQETVAARAKQADASHRRALEELRPVLQEAGEEPGSDAQVAERVEVLRRRQTEGVHEQASAAAGAVAEWLTRLARAVTALYTVPQAHQAWQEALAARHAARLQRAWPERVAERRKAHAGLREKQRAEQAQRIRSQLENLEHELSLYETRMAEQIQRPLHVLGTLKAVVERAATRANTLRRTAEKRAGEGMLERADQLAQAGRDPGNQAADAAGRLQAMLQAREQWHLRRQKFREQQMNLRAELAGLETAQGEEPGPPQSLHVRGEPGEADRLHHVWQREHEAVQGLLREARGAQAQAEEALRTAKGMRARTQRFAAQRDQFVKLAARRRRLHDSLHRLKRRQQEMEAELADLPTRVQEKFMPARKRLLLEVFVPEAKRRLNNLHKARVFVRELLSLSREKVRELYLDRAIYRRFHARQFVRGAVVQHDPAHTRAAAFRNVTPALNRFEQALRYNLQGRNGSHGSQPEVRALEPRGPQALLSYLEGLAAQGAECELDFLVLPPVLTPAEGLQILNRKDALFNGVPRLVGVFITKLGPTELQTDHDLREAYFRAVRHNVVVNIDGRDVVDNPRAIASRLLSETLGSAHDLERVFDLPEEASGMISSTG